MVLLAFITASSVFILIIIDVVKYKSSKKLVSRLAKVRSNVLEKVDRVTNRIENLVCQIERKTDKQETSKDKEGESVPSSLSAIVMEKPYTRVSVTSGIHYIVASHTSSGHMMLEDFLKDEITLSRVFHKPVVKGIAELMLETALEEFKRYSPKEPSNVSELPFNVAVSSMI